MNHVHQFQVKRLQPSPDSNHYPFGNKSESFMDVLIDGRSMYDMLKQHDRIPCFGWGNHELLLFLYIVMIDRNRKGALI